MAPRSVPLQLEIRQQRPFPSPYAEAAVGLMRTADVVRRAVTAVVEPRGVTAQQYNVLRILRGVHPEPLPTLEIATRMIEQTPGITRLLDRLEAKQLVRRQRCRDDRRQVHCWITDAGLALLAALDAPVARALEAGFEDLGATATKRLSRQLDRVRAGFRNPAEKP